MRAKKASLTLFALAILAFSLSACSRKNAEAPAAPQQRDQAQSTQAAGPRPARNPLKNAYFGDLHLHSGYSMDAFAFGTRTTPEDSYKYAMGETVEYMGKPQKRIAPLDFLAVTDHAEYLGVVREPIDPNGPFANSEWYKIMTNPDPAVSATAFRKLIGSTIVNKPLPQFSNLHRCVIFADKGPAIPYTAFESVDPEDLWRYLEAQRKQGLDVIAVP